MPGRAQARRPLRGLMGLAGVPGQAVNTSCLLGGPGAPLNGPAVVKQFSSLTLPVGYSMTVENPCQGLIIYCQGNAVINGTGHVKSSELMRTGACVSILAAAFFSVVVYTYWKWIGVL